MHEQVLKWLCRDKLWTGDTKASMLQAAAEAGSLSAVQWLRDAKRSKQNQVDWPAAPGYFTWHLDVLEWAVDDPDGKLQLNEWKCGTAAKRLLAAQAAVCAARSAEELRECAAQAERLKELFLWAHDSPHIVGRCNVSFALFSLYFSAMCPVYVLLC